MHHLRNRGEWISITGLCLSLQKRGNSHWNSETNLHKRKYQALGYLSQNKAAVSQQASQNIWKSLPSFAGESQTWIHRLISLSLVCFLCSTTWWKHVSEASKRFRFDLAYRHSRHLVCDEISRWKEAYSSYRKIKLLNSNTSLTKSKSNHTRIKLNI
jgi:hypothetical protein